MYRKLTLSLRILVTLVIVMTQFLEPVGVALAYGQPAQTTRIWSLSGVMRSVLSGVNFSPVETPQQAFMSLLNTYMNLPQDTPVEVVAEYDRQLQVAAERLSSGGTNNAPYNYTLLGQPDAANTPGTAWQLSALPEGDRQVFDKTFNQMLESSISKTGTEDSNPVPASSSPQPFGPSATESNTTPKSTAPRYTEPVPAPSRFARPDPAAGEPREIAKPMDLMSRVADEIKVEMKGYYYLDGSGVDPKGNSYDFPNNAVDCEGVGEVAEFDMLFNIYSAAGVAAEYNPGIYGVAPGGWIDVNLSTIIDLTVSTPSIALESYGWEVDSSGNANEWIANVWLEFNEFTNPELGNGEEKYIDAYAECDYRLYYVMTWQGPGYTDLNTDVSIVSSGTSGDGVTHPGDPIRYRVEVTNQGPAVAKSGTLMNTLPAALLDPTNITTGGGMTCSTADSCTFTNLAKGSTAWMEFSATVDRYVGNIKFEAEAFVDSENQDDNEADNKASIDKMIVPAHADIQISAQQISPLNGRYAGEDITYRMTIRNNGPDKAFLVNVDNTAPNNTSGIWSDPSDPYDVDCSSGDDCVIDLLGPGGSVYIDYTATVNDWFWGNVTGYTGVSINTTYNNAAFDPTSNNNANQTIYVPPDALLSLTFDQPAIWQKTRAGDTLYPTTITVLNGEGSPVGSGHSQAVDVRLQVNPPAGSAVTPPDDMVCTAASPSFSADTCKLNNLMQNIQQTTVMTITLPDTLEEVVTHTVQARPFMNTNGTDGFSPSFANYGRPVQSSYAYVNQVTRLTNWNIHIGQPGVPQGVYAIAYSQDKMYIGGGAANAPASGFLAYLNKATMSWVYLSNTLNGPVYALEPDGSGGVYVGGAFSGAAGNLTDARYLVQVSKTGQWSNVNGGVESLPDAADAVYAIRLSDTGKLYIGGHFDQVGAGLATPVEARSIAVLDLNSSTWTQIGPEGLSGSSETSGVYTIALDGDYVYAGGEFTYGGITAETDTKSDNIIRWNNLYGAWEKIGSPNSTVRSAVVIDSRLFIGGEFTRVDETDSRGIAMWYEGKWYTLGIDPTLGGRVNALAVVGHELYAAGEFTRIGGQTASRIARWNGVKWIPLGLGVNDKVFAIAVEPGTPDVAVGGEFVGVSGTVGSEPMVPSNHIAHYQSRINDLSIQMITQTTGMLGDPITYTLSITNNGAQSATEVSVWDWLPQGFTYQSNTGGCAQSGEFVRCNVGTLAAGGTWNVTLYGQISPEAASNMDNIAYVTSRFPDMTPENNVARQVLQTGALSDLSLAMTGTVSAVSGSDISFNLTAHNGGPSSGVQTRVVFTLPNGGAAFRNSLGANCNVTKNYTNLLEVTCGLGSMPPGATSTFTLTLNSASTVLGNLPSEAYITSLQPDENLANNSATASTFLSPEADMYVALSAPKLALPEEFPSRYNLTVTNRGLSAGSAQAVVTLPVQVTFSSATTGCVYQSSPHQVVCSQANLLPGQTMQQTISFLVKTDTPDGTVLVTQASVASTNTLDPDPANNFVSTSTMVVTDPSAVGADLKVTQNVSATTRAGDTATFTITLFNQGAAAARNVVVEDILPAGMTFSPFSSSGFCYEALPGVVNCTLSALANGESRTVLVGGRINAALATGTALVNNTRVYSSVADYEQEDNRSTITSTVVVASDLALTMTVNDSQILQNEVVTYTLVVTNNGPSVATSISLVNPQPDEMNLISSAVPSNGTCSVTTLTVNCTLNDLQPAQTSTIQLVVTGQVGLIVNQATVSNLTDAKTSNNTAQLTVRVSALGRNKIVYGPIEVQADVVYNRPDGSKQGIGEIWLGRNYSLSNYRDTVTLNSAGTLLSGSGTVTMREEGLDMFTGRFTVDLNGILTPAADVIWRLDQIAGFDVNGSLAISRIDLVNGITYGTATLHLKPNPAIDLYRQANFTITPNAKGPQYGGTLNDFELSLAGCVMEMTSPMIVNDGILSQYALFNLPANLGGGGTQLQNVKIKVDALVIGGGKASFALPEIKIGGADYAKLVNGKVSLVLEDTGYILSGQAALQITLPDNSVSFNTRIVVDQGGQLVGTLKNLELTLACSKLTMKAVTVTALGVFPEASILDVYLKSASGQKFKVALTGVAITGAGLVLNNGPFNVPLADIKVGNGKNMRYGNVLAKLDTDAGSYIYNFDVSMQLRLPQNNLDIPLAVRVDSSGEFGDTMEKLKLDVSFGTLVLENVFFDTSGLESEDAKLSLVKGSMVNIFKNLDDVKINENGLSLGDTFPIHDFNIAEVFSISDASLTLGIGRDRNYIFTLKGTVEMNAPGISATSGASSNLIFFSNGDVTGDLAPFYVEIVGLRLLVGGGKFENDIFLTKQAGLKMPDAWGGASVQVYNLRISPGGVRIGGGRFEIPSVKAGSVSLANLYGEFMEEGNGWVISAGGKFLVPGLGGGKSCGIVVGVTFYLETGQQPAMIISDADERTPLLPSISCSPAQRREASMEDLAADYEEFAEGDRSMRGAFALRRVIVGLEGCEIPIGSTGFYLSRVVGTLTLNQGTTKIDLEVTVTGGPRFGDTRAIRGDMALNLAFEPWKMDLAGSVTVFSIFKAAEMSATAKQNFFSASIKIRQIWPPLVGQASFTVWTTDGKFHLIGRASVEILIEAGSIFNYCLDMGLFKICIYIPPYDINLGGVYVEFGEFVKGSGSAWGLKGWISVFGFDVGIFFDSSGRFKVGSVDEFHLVTPPEVRRALALQRKVQAKAVQLDTLSAQDLALMHDISANATQTIITKQVPVKTDTMFILAQVGTGLGFSLRSPSGKLVTPDSLPAGVSYNTSTQDGNKQDIFSVQSAEKGEWQMIITGDPDNAQFLAQMLGANPPPVIEDVEITDLGNNQIRAAWKLTSDEADTSLAVYANPGATFELATETGVIMPVYDGIPVMQDVTSALDGTLSTANINLNSLPAGTYSIWLTSDDGRNPPSRIYATKTIEVTHVWASTWESGIQASPSYRTLDVAWNRHPNPDADSYALLYSTAPDGSDPVRMDVGPFYAFTLDTLTPGQMYYLWLEAADLDTGLVSTSEVTTGVPEGQNLTLQTAATTLNLIAGASATVDVTMKTSTYPVMAPVAMTEGRVADGLYLDVPSDPFWPTATGVQSFFTIRTDDGLPTGSYTAQVVVSGGGTEKALNYTVNVENTTPDFRLAATPTTILAEAEGTYTVVVQAVPVYGFSAPIELDLDSLPDGMSYAYSPASITPGVTSTLALEVSPEAANDTHMLTLLGSGNYLNHELSLPFTINRPLFRLETENERLGMEAGNRVVFAFDLVLENWDDPVLLSLDSSTSIPGARLGLTTAPQLAPEASLTVSQGGTYYVELITSADTVEDTYPIQVNAVSGGAARSLVLQAQVMPASGTTNLKVSQIQLTAPVLAGSTATIRVDVVNLGPNQATELVLNARLPDQVTLNSVETGNWRCNLSNNPFQCYMAGLDIGETARLWVTMNIGADIPQWTELQSLAIVDMAEPDFEILDNSTRLNLRVEHEADLEVTQWAAPAAVTSGEPAAYTMTVTNHGPSIAADTVLLNMLPNGVTVVSALVSAGSCDLSVPGQVACKVGSLTAGETAAATLTLSALPATRGTLTNHLTGFSSTTDPNPANNQALATVTVQPQVDLSVIASALPDPAVAGRMLSYTFEVGNAGPSDANDVVFSGQFSKKISDLNVSATNGDCAINGAGDTWLVTCQMGTQIPQIKNYIRVYGMVQTDVAAATTLPSQASVVTGGGETEIQPANNAVSLGRRVNAQADLAMTITSVTNTVRLNQEITYIATITNHGPSDALAAQMTSDLPDGFTPSSLTATQGSCAVTDGRLACSLGLLPVNQAATLTLVMLPVGGVKPTNEVIVKATSQLPDPQGENNQAAVLTEVLLKVDMMVDHFVNPENPAPGERAAYYVTVENLSGVTAKPVTATVMVSKVLTDLRITNPLCVVSDSGTSWVITCNYEQLSGGEKKSIIFSGMVPIDTPAGKITSEVTVTSANGELSGNLGNNEDMLTTTLVPRTDLSLTLAASAALVRVGDPASYQISVTNTGPSHASEVLLTQVLPPELINVTVQPAANCALLPGSVTCAWDSLLLGQTATAVVSGVVSLDAAAPLETLVSVTGSQVDPQNLNNSARHSLDIQTITDLSLALSSPVSLTEATSGGLMRLTLTAANLGASQANQSTLTVSFQPAGQVEMVNVSQGSCTAGAELVCDLGQMALNQMATVTLDLRVPAEFTGNLVTWATLETDSYDSESNNNLVTQTTVVKDEIEIYADDFEDSTLDPVWALGGMTGTAPSGEKFLGSFSTQTARLKLDILPAHDLVLVSFDLYILNSWKGNGSAQPDLNVIDPDRLADMNVTMPSIWQTYQVGQAPLVYTTFSNLSQFQQAFPGEYPGSANPAQTQAAAMQILGYPQGDAVYKMFLLIPHSDAEIQLDFSALYLQDASWALDNIKVRLQSGYVQMFLPMMIN